MSHSTSFPPIEPRSAPPRSARDLIAVLYRQVGLIAACAFVGAAVALVLSVPQAPAAQHERRLAAAAMRLFEAELAPPGAGRASRGAAQIGLKLDLDPGLVVAVEGAASAAGAAPEPRLKSTDAGSRMSVDASGRPVVDKDKAVAWLGPLAGLLLGLLVAAVRELGRDRMRSPREAEWALGVPVLGTIPTLSAKARDAWFETPAGVRDATPAEAA